MDKIKIVLEDGAYKPTRAHLFDAGLDLYSRENAKIWGMSRHIFDTGVHVEIPEGYVGMITSKSGLMVKSGVITDGTIDSGYTGSIRVCLFNHNECSVYIKPGEKIAQLVIYPIATPDLEVVDRLEDTERGSNGFGSTGRF